MEKIQLAQSGVVFDKEHHTYHLGDKELQGVTSTLVHRAYPNKYDGIPEDRMKAAAVRGTAIHEKIEAYEADIDYSFSPELLSWVTFMEEKKMTHVASEYLVTDFEKYASAIDHVLQDEDGNVYLIDVKTNYEPPYDTAALQLSIYRRFFMAMNPDAKVAACVMVWLRGDKSEWKELPTWADECLDELFAADAKDKPYDITTTYGDLPAKVADVEAYLAQLDAEVKAKTAEMEAIKAGLCQLMLDNKVKKFTTSRLSLCLVTPKPRKSFDSKSFQKDNPDLYEKYVKTSEVKPSIRITFAS